MRSGFPIFLGYLPVGLAYGILAAQHGFTWWEAVAASGAAISGAGQFVALSTAAASGSLVAALVASGIVNLRYVLFSATLSPHVRRIRALPMAWLGFTVTDESFAVNMAEIKRGTATPLTMAGVGAIAWVGWVLGTLVGALGAGRIGDASRFGVDFAMPAMYAALFVALAQNRRHVICGVGAAAIALGLYACSRVGLAIPQHWFIVIAAPVAATLAVLVFKPSGRDLTGEDAP